MAMPGTLKSRWPSGTTDSGDGTTSRIGMTGTECEHSGLRNGDADDVEKTPGVSSIMYTLSDMNLSGSSDGFEFENDAKRYDSEETDVKKRIEPPSPVDLRQQFLPPTKNQRCAQSFAMCNTDPTEAAAEINRSLDATMASGYYTDCTINTTVASGYYTMIQDFDVSSMKEKLEAQKQFLFDSFEKHPTLPHAFSWKSDKAKKLGGQKLKSQLHKLSRAARHFLSRKILRQQPSVQRCELQLIGCDDRVERLLLVMALHSGSGHQEQTMHVSLPSFFETGRVLVPRALLAPPGARSGLRVRVTGYGIAGQKEGSAAADFRDIVVSGVCTVQLDSRPLLSAMLVLQPHTPGRSLTSLGRAVQSSGTRVKTTHYEPNEMYTFCTTPCLVSGERTELCMLQRADPFREQVSLSPSSCDCPALFQTSLKPGQYHSVCVYRLIANPAVSSREVFDVVTATPPVYFRAYLDQALVGEQLQQAREAAGHSDPVLCPSLMLITPPSMDMQSLLRVLGSSHNADTTNTTTMNNTTTNTNNNNNTSLNTTASTSSSRKSESEGGEEGLYLCAWSQDRETDTETDSAGSSWYPLTAGWTAAPNPRLPPGSRPHTQVPSLSVFNLGVELLFGQLWTHYDRTYVTLVLCPRHSTCHRLCRRRLMTLDPYHNPFLFRRRFLDPEPSVAVFAADSGRMRVEVIHTHSPHALHQVFACSETLFTSKLRVHNTSSFG